MEVGPRGGPVVPYRHCWLPPRFSKVGPGSGSVRSCWLPSTLGAIIRPLRLPGYTVSGPPRSHLAAPRDRYTLHFDFTAGEDVCGGVGGFSGYRGLRFVVPGRLLVLGAGLAVVWPCFCWFGFL